MNNEVKTEGKVKKVGNDYVVSGGFVTSFVGEVNGYQQMISWNMMNIPRPKTLITFRGPAKISSY